jgi:plastocyanin
MQSARRWMTAIAMWTVAVAALVVIAPASTMTTNATTTASTRSHAALVTAVGESAQPRRPHAGGVMTARVKISNFKFGPATVTIKAGTKVVWTNDDAIAHSVNFKTTKLDSKTLGEGDRFSHTFTTPGTYTYICAIHPFMHGTIRVTA